MSTNTTARRYDRIPYPEWTIAESHFSHLAVIGRMFGLATVKPDACRVLELGCASGGNIIPMAFYWPQSQFVGIELSGKQAATAGKSIADLGLKNIQVLNEDILRINSKKLGTFDYIIVHGVFSWVPEKVQNKILEICRTMLNKNGLAYISYNTLPGWSMRNMVREMLLYHSRKAANPAKQLQQSREFLHILADSLPRTGSLSEQWLQREASDLTRVPADYIAHDYLEENNRPMFFRDFISKANEHELKYVAEANLYTMLDSSLSAPAQAFLDNVTDVTSYEQYLDFFYVKHFRQTLLCHQRARTSRTINLDNMHKMHFLASPSCQEEIDLHSDSRQEFKSITGEKFHASHPLTKAALVELAMAYPASRSYGELLQSAAQIIGQYGNAALATETDRLRDELLELFFSGMVALSLVPCQPFSQVSDYPQAHALARLGARQGKPHLASVHHHTLEVSHFDRCLLKLLDGRTAREQLPTAMFKSMEKDPTLAGFLSSPMDRMDLRTAELTRRIDSTLHHFANHGLLQA